MKCRGMSLLEIVISLALVALGIVFVLGIIPTGVLSIKRSEDIEAATAYSLYLIDDARRGLPSELSQHFVVTFNKTEFTITRDVYAVDETCSDVVVTARWNPEMPGIRLATRVRGLPPEPTPTPTPDLSATPTPTPPSHFEGQPSQ